MPRDLKEILEEAIDYFKDKMGMIIAIVFDKVVKAELKLMWDTVLEEVHAAEEVPDLVGEEKRIRAIACVNDRLIQAGIKPIDTNINLAIEIAVQYVRKVTR